MLFQDVILYFKKYGKNDKAYLNIIYNKDKEIINIPFFNRFFTYDKNINESNLLLNVDTHLQIDDNCFLFISDYQNNFHHFTVEMLYLLEIYKSYNNFKLCIQENLNSYITSYLDNLPFINKNLIYILKPNINYNFKNIFVNNKEFDIKTIINKINIINCYLPLKTLNYYPERIFIFRKNNKRTMVNFNEIEPILKKYNFYFFSPEESDLITQFNIINNCKILCCELGAGCANMFYLKPSSKMIILSFMTSWVNNYNNYNILSDDTKKINISILNGIKIKGNEHECTWKISPIIVEKMFKKL